MNKKQLNEIILAIETPRGGSENHRWIAASAEPVTDVQLTKTLQTLDRFPSDVANDFGVVIKREVVQPSSGRQAREYLFLYCPEFMQISEPDRNRCQEALNCCVNSIPQILQSINFSAGIMVYQNDTLNRFFQEISQVLAQANTTGKSSDNLTSNPYKGEKDRRGYFGCTLVFALIVLLCSAGFFAAKNALRGLREKCEQYCSGDDEGNPSAGENKTVQDGKSCDSDPKKDPEKAPQEVLNQCAKLFKTETSQKNDIETVYRKAIESVYSCSGIKNELELSDQMSLEKYANQGKLFEVTFFCYATSATKIKDTDETKEKVRTKDKKLSKEQISTLPVYGAKDKEKEVTYQNWNILNGTDPVEYHKALKKLYDTSEGFTDEYSTIKEGFTNITKDTLWNVTNATPMFFFARPGTNSDDDSDAAIAKAILKAACECGKFKAEKRKVDDNGQLANKDLVEGLKNSIVEDAKAQNADLQHALTALAEFIGLLQPAEDE